MYTSVHGASLGLTEVPFFEPNDLLLLAAYEAVGNARVEEERRGEERRGEKSGVEWSG